MSDAENTIPRGSKVLVTGANGFIGSNFVDQLLGLGYLVRGTVRENKPWLNEIFDQKYGAIDGIAGVIHVAADLSMSPDPAVSIPNAVQATVSILEAASQQPTNKRFVLTSSSTAAYLSDPGKEGIVITTDTWNDASINAAWDENTPAHAKRYISYGASKTEAERAVFKWIEENNRPFIFNTVLPGITFGKILALEIRGSTQSLINNILRGNSSVFGFLTPQWYVDVTDTARLHVAALLSPSVRFERILAFATPHNWTDVIKILRKLLPANPMIPSVPENECKDLSDVLPSRRAEEILKSFFKRPGWVSLEDSINEGIFGVE